MKDSILIKILKKDFLNQKAINIITFIFISLATFLISLAIILVFNLFSSMEMFMQKSQTPHMIQMHSGPLNEKSVESFANDNSKVKDYQILEFLNIENSRISNGKDSLSQSIQDNGFSVQSNNFDFLLDSEGNIAKPEQGEVYVPLTYYKNDFFKTGDSLYIDDVPFKVSGFIRDSQMNSELSSSKRFLVHEEDYKKIESLGNKEYLIEFLVNDLDDLDAFENEYANSELPSNGPTITYSLIKIINALSDGLTIGMMLLSSFLTIAIALICIRFTLIAKMEEEFKEISILKALGVRYREIKKMYMAKYFLITLTGALLGYGLSVAFKERLLKNIYLYLGKVQSYSGELFAFIGIIATIVIILFFISNILNRYKKITVVDALRDENTDSYGNKVNRMKLTKNCLVPFNLYASIKDILARKKLYINLFAIIIFATIIITIPQKIYTTLNSENFIEYLGVGKSDIRIDIQQIDDIEERSKELLNAIKADNRTLYPNMITTKSFKTNSAIESLDLKISLGDHTKFPIKYTQGKFPESENEIALSQLSQEALTVNMNDSIIVETSDGIRRMRVVGIYQDVTNGGKTAKATFEDNEAPVMNIQMNFNIDEKTSSTAKLTEIENIVNEYKTNFSFAKISNTQEYLHQTLGSSIYSIKSAAIISKIIAVSIVFLVVSLFVRMIIAKDNREISIMAALGLKKKDIQLQYIYRVLIVFIISLGIGLLVSSIVGSKIVTIFLSSMGVTSFKFLGNKFTTYFVNPVILLVVTMFAAYISSKEVKVLNIIERMKE